MPPKISLEKDKTRKAFLRLAVKQDSEIDVLIEDLEGDFDRLLQKYGGSNEINQKSAIDKATPIIISAFIVAYLTVLKRYNRDVADVSAQGEYDRILALYGSVLSLSPIVRAFRNETLNYGDDVFKRLLHAKTFEDGRTLAQRLRILELGSTKTIRNIVAQGIAEKETAKVIGQKIQAYVDPRLTKKRVAPWELFRRRFDRKKSFVPKDIPAGSIAHNAIRIGRTEINNTFRNTSKVLHRDKPWNKGFYWRLSASHPKPDICDDWAAHGLYKNEAELPLGHVNCFCYIEPVTMSKAEFEKELERG